MSQMPMTRVVLALLGWVVMPGSELSDTRVPVAPVSQALVALEGAEPLTSSYGLSVVDVAPVPEFVREVIAETVPEVSDPVRASGCPFELRAVVVGEDAADSFAMVAVEGESRLVRAGESLSLRGAKWSVVELAENAVTVRAGESRVSCGLAN